MSNPHRKPKQSRILAEMETLPPTEGVLTRTRDWVFHRDKYRCLRCHHPKRENLTIDHIFPKAMGGGDNVGNLQTLCWKCNQLKGNSLTTDYRDNKTAVAGDSYLNGGK